MTDANSIEALIVFIAEVEARFPDVKQRASTPVLVAILQNLSRFNKNEDYLQTLENAVMQDGTLDASTRRKLIRKITRDASYIRTLIDYARQTLSKTPQSTRKVTG